MSIINLTVGKVLIQLNFKNRGQPLGSIRAISTEWKMPYCSKCSMNLTDWCKPINKTHIKYAEVQ